MTAQPCSIDSYHMGSRRSHRSQHNTSYRACSTHISHAQCLHPSLVKSLNSLPRSPREPKGSVPPVKSVRGCMASGVHRAEEPRLEVLQLRPRNVFLSLRVIRHDQRLSPLSSESPVFVLFASRCSPRCSPSASATTGGSRQPHARHTWV